MGRRLRAESGSESLRRAEELERTVWFQTSEGGVGRSSHR